MREREEETRTKSGAAARRNRVTLGRVEPGRLIRPLASSDRTEVSRGGGTLSERIRTGLVAASSAFTVWESQRKSEACYCNCILFASNRQTIPRYLKFTAELSNERRKRPNGLLPPVQGGSPSSLVVPHAILVTRHRACTQSLFLNCCLPDGLHQDKIPKSERQGQRPAAATLSPKRAHNTSAITSQQSRTSGYHRT